MIETLPTVPKIRLKLTTILTSFTQSQQTIQQGHQKQRERQWQQQRHCIGRRMSSELE